MRGRKVNWEWSIIVGMAFGLLFLWAFQASISYAAPMRREDDIENQKESFFCWPWVGCKRQNARDFIMDFEGRQNICWACGWSQPWPETKKSKPRIKPKPGEPKLFCIAGR